VSYTVSFRENMGPSRIVVVGCGGTGSFVVDGLCRLFINRNASILLVDYDRVEPHNLQRQGFFAEDLGKFKSQALAVRMARQYKRPIAYSVYPYDREMINVQSRSGTLTSVVKGLIIGCVDEANARRSIASGMQWGDWWLDAGNGLQSGQVLIGNTKSASELENAFREEEQTVSYLPLPSLQLPSLLIPPTKPIARQDCAEAIELDGQSPTINQAMAVLVLEFIYRLLTGKLTWMGAYIDLEAGTLQTVPAEPVTVARMLGVKVDTLIYEASKRGRR